MLEYAKGIRVKSKMREAQSALKKRDVACFVGIGFIVLQVYEGATCLYYWSLTTIHHSSFMISLPSKPQSPLVLIVPCIIMGGELRATTSLW